MALLIPTTGPVLSVQPRDTDKGFAEDELCTMLACGEVWVYSLDEPTAENPMFLIVDEAGTLTPDAEVNTRATNLAGQCKIHTPGKFICGRALVCNRFELYGAGEQ